MDFNELDRFLSKNLQNLQNKYHFKNKTDVNLLAKRLKISEEVGEFSENILKYLSYQRSEKLHTDVLSDIEEECADVVITACLVLKELELDPAEALAKKIAKISARGGV